jgi:HK97 family phage major capsid protein
MKTISNRIQDAETKLVESRDQLFKAVEALDTAEDQSAAQAVVDTLTLQVESETKSLDNLMRAESALVSKAAATPAINTTPGANLKDSQKADLIFKSALVTFDAYCSRTSVDEVLAKRYGDNEALKMVVNATTKAAQNPAMTNVPGYAQELVRDSYGAFMDLLRGESVIPRIPMNRYEFDGYASIKIPSRAAQNPNLAGAFRAEGAPIRVGAISLTSQTLTPKSLAVIGTFTNELLERSTPSIEAVIRDAMIQDTAYALDLAFLGATPASATAPGGMQTYATGDNTAASTGNSNANIIADLRGRLTQMASLNMSRRPVWVMHPSRFMGVQMAITATGAYQFPEAQNGQLMGVQVVTSTNVPNDVVYLLDAAEIGFAGGAPRFLGSEMATIHEEYDTPLPIVGGVEPTPVVARPVRSLYQTNSQALRCIWQLDWTVMREGAAQTITGVAW